MYFGPSISVGRRGVSYGDSDAQAFIAATGLTGTTEVNAVNNLVANLKSYGLWSKMKAIYPFVSDTYNQFSYTEDLTNAAWQKVTTVATANATTAPDGTNTGWSITGGNIRQILATTGTNAYTCYVKKKTNRYFFVTIYAGGIDNVVWGDLDTGLITQTQNSVSNASMTSVANGWYKLTFNFNVTNVSTEVWLPMCCTASGSFTRGTDIYVWHPQFELGSTFSNYQYIATTPANRFVSQFKYNLKDARDLDAAFRLAFNGTWTYSKQGATPNGTNGYANTYLTPSTSLGSTFSLSYYSNIDITSTSPVSCEIGAFQSASQMIGLSLRRNLSSDMFGTDGYGVSALSTSTNSNFFGIASRSSTTSLKLWKNTTLAATNTSTDTGTKPTIQITLALNNGLTGYSNRRCAFSHIGDGLSDTEVANLYTTVQTFETELSRYTGVPIVSDANAQAFLNAAVITDNTQANAVNTLVTDLKTYGLWTKMKAIYPFVGGTASTHKWNLKDPRDLDAAYRLAFSGAWTHSSTGALPNGANAYADSFLIPSTALTLNNTSFGYYSRTNSSQSPSATEMAVGSSGTQLMYLRTKNSSGNAEGYSYNTNPAIVANANSQGLYNVSRITNSSLKLYKNGSSIASLLTTQTGTLPSNKFYLGAVNYSGTVGEYSNKESAFAYIGDGFSDTEAANLYTAVQKYQTSLSRQV